MVIVFNVFVNWVGLGVPSNIYNLVTLSRKINFENAICLILDKNQQENGWFSIIE